MSLAFSADGKCLAAQGGAPDWTLCLWLWEKSKLVASVRTVSTPGHTAVQCLFQPGRRAGRQGCGSGRLHVQMLAPPASAHVRSAPHWPPPFSSPPHGCTGDDPQYVSVVGEGTCCLYQIEAGNTLRHLPTVLPKRESTAFTCHAWLTDNDAPAGGLVVGSRRGEVLVVVEGDVKQALQLEEGCSVEALVAHSKVRCGQELCGWVGVGSGRSVE